MNINSFDLLNKHSGLFKLGCSTLVHNLSEPNDVSLGFDILVKTNSSQFFATFVDKTILNGRKNGKHDAFIFKKKFTNEYVKLSPTNIKNIEFQDHFDERRLVSKQALFIFLWEDTNTKTQ